MAGGIAKGGMYDASPQVVSRVVIDSSVRNPERFPSSNEFETDVSDLYLQEIVQVRLAYANVPFPEPHVTRGRNLLYLSGAASPACILTCGEYTSVLQLCRELTLSLRRDSGPGFYAYPTHLGRVTIASFTPFTIHTVSTTQTKDALGFQQNAPLQGSAAAVLGFAPTPGGQAALSVGTATAPKYLALASHPPLSQVDQVAIVRVTDACAIKSSSRAFDRAFAVLHNGRDLDPLPNVHVTDPARVTLKKLRIRLERRDGELFDTDGRDFTLHLDFVKWKPNAPGRL